METMPQDLRYAFRLMACGQGLRTIFIGVAIGITGSLALTRTVESLLFSQRMSRRRK